MYVILIAAPGPGPARLWSAKWSASSQIRALFCEKVTALKKHARAPGAEPPPRFSHRRQRTRRWPAPDNWGDDLLLPQIRAVHQPCLSQEGAGHDVEALCTSCPGVFFYSAELNGNTSETRHQDIFCDDVTSYLGPGFATLLTGSGRGGCVSRSSPPPMSAQKQPTQPTRVEQTG